MRGQGGLFDVEERLSDFGDHPSPSGKTRL